MIECQACTAPTTGLNLCQHCITELRQQLSGLPTWTNYLHDTAIGHTKLSENPRRTQPCSNTPQLNPAASQLLDDIDSTLGQWARHIARTHRHIISPPVTWHRAINEYRHTSRDYAIFLAGRTKELAADPDIGELVDELHHYINRIEKLINRPIPPQFCGPCPTVITDHSNCRECEHRAHDCGTRLMASRNGIQVTCPECKTTHDVQKLLNHLLARADHFRCTIPEIHRVLHMLGEPIPRSTLYHWVTRGQLTPRGYLQADNKSIGLTRRHHNDKPVYHVADARKQRAQTRKVNT